MCCCNCLASICFALSLSLSLSHTHTHTHTHTHSLIYTHKDRNNSQTLSLLVSIEILQIFSFNQFSSFLPDVCKDRQSSCALLLKHLKHSISHHSFPVDNSKQHLFENHFINISRRFLPSTKTWLPQTKPAHNDYKPMPMRT